MRKIKELEERIRILENRFQWHDNGITELKDVIGKLTIKVDEQEKFLKEIVCPFIAEKLAEDLSDHFKGLGDVLADLFTEEPKKTAKNVKKTTSRDEKSVGKKTNKAKKENK